MANLVNLKTRTNREFNLFTMTGREILDVQENNILEIFAAVNEIGNDSKVSFAVFVKSGDNKKILYPLNKPFKKNDFFTKEQLQINDASILTIEALEFTAMSTLRRIQSLSARSDTKKPLGFRIHGSFVDKTVDWVVLYREEDAKMNAVDWVKELYS